MGSARTPWIPEDAVPGSWRGIRVAWRFGDVAEEWRALRRGAGVVPASYRTWVEVRGEDRVAFLHGLLSQDIQRLKPGTVAPSFALDAAGKVVAHLYVLAEEERLVLDLPAWVAPRLLEHLERYLVADEVEFVQPQEPVALLALEGPQSPAVLERVLGEAPPEAGRHTRVTVDGRLVRVVGVSELGGPGFRLAVPAGSAPEMFAALRDAGASPVGLAALDVCRVEAGVPWPGLDMDESVLAMETGRLDAISFDKGCYLGQEVVERIHSRGHVNRTLRVLVLEKDASLPPSQTPVEFEGRAAGETRSAVLSVALDRPVALAWIHRRAEEPGTEVELRLPDRRVRAEVRKPPVVLEAGEGEGG